MHTAEGLITKRNRESFCLQCFDSVDCTSGSIYNLQRLVGGLLFNRTFNITCLLRPPARKWSSSSLPSTPEPARGFKLQTLGFSKTQKFTWKSSGMVWYGTVQFNVPLDTV